jgi:hydrogenase/urease accessory protein HupE
MVKSLVTALLLVLTVLFGTEVKAHEVRPALLNVTEIESGIFYVTLKMPALGDRVVKLTPIFPEGFDPLGPPMIRMARGSYIENITLKSVNGQTLFGKRIIMDGLSSLQIDVLVQMEFADETFVSAIVQPKSPVFEVPERGSKAKVAGSYFGMGVYHILSGIDHLLFVLALMLIVANSMKLLKTITAFTLAHSITLALAALGTVNVPPAPTEAIIALSIVFLCVEIINSKQGKSSITEKYPWMVAMIFGLFHGLGFAGALSEVGLPQHEIPLALFMFNVGVEAGQVMFLGVIFLLKIIIEHLKINWPDKSWKILPYAIGCLAAFWVVQRTISFL